MKTSLGSPAIRAVLDNLHEQQANMERNWEGLFVPPEGEPALRQRAVIVHQVRTGLKGMVETCQGMQVKAQAAFAPPDLQAEIAGLLKFFAAKRDEIERRMRPQ